MLLSKLETVEQVTDEQVNYLAGLAQTLATQNDFAIQNYADSSVTNPDVQKILQSKDVVNLLKEESPQEAAFDTFNIIGNGANMFALSLPQENSLFTDIWPKIKSLFSSFRRKVKRVFCKAVASLGGDKELDLKTIIKHVLLALIPAFAATTGLMPIALPIVVSLAALTLKYGVGKVCPV